MAEPSRRKRRKPVDDPALDRVLDEVLNNKIQIIPEFADLPRRWREAPEKASDRKHPWERAKDELLARYIWLGFSHPSAREGLRRPQSRSDNERPTHPRALALVEPLHIYSRRPSHVPRPQAQDRPRRQGRFGVQVPGGLWTDP